MTFLDKVGLQHLWSKIVSKLNNKVDKVSGKELSTNDYTTAEKNKLADIDDGANAYVHPNTHEATMITQDATHRFLTDTERTQINEWNTFKNNGGAIGGTVSTEVVSLAHDDATNNPNGTHFWLQNSKGALYFQYRNVNGWVDNPVYINDSLFVVGRDILPIWKNKNLGQEGTEQVWKNIYLDGVLKDANGYTKLPNGFIMQWGLCDLTVPQGGTKAGLFDLHVPFTIDYGMFGAAQAILNVDNNNALYTDLINCICSVANKNQIRIAASDIGNKLTSNITFRINWMAISH